MKNGPAVLREMLIAFLFLVLAAAMTWPLVRNLSQAVSDPHDSFFTAWNLEWDYYATIHGKPLFEANLFHPARHTLAFSEHLYGIALFLFPLFAAGISPLAIQNIAIILGFAGCGYATYRLALRATRQMEPAIIAGIAYAFVGMRFHHLPHIHYLWSVWLPVLLLSMIAFVERPDWKRAAALTAASILNGLTSLTWLAFGSIATLLTAVILAALTGRWRERRFWIGLTAAGITTLLVLTPFIVPYLEVARLYGMQRTFADVLPGSSADWLDWLQPNYQNRLYGRFSPGAAYGHERTLLPGIAVLLLAIVGLLRGRRSLSFAASLLWIVIGALGARGLYGWFGTLLFSLPGFSGIRLPVRWAMVSFAGIALLAALGVEFVLRERPRGVRIGLTCAIAMVLLFEMRIAPIRWYLIPTEPRPVYEWLRSASIEGPILELPMTQEKAYEYLWRATAHHRPLLNGVSSYLPPDYDHLTSLYESHPIAGTFIDELEAKGCSLIVVHEGALGERSSEIRQWLQRGLDSHRIAFVRRFEAGRHGDFVFALKHSSAPVPEEAVTFLNGAIGPFDNLCGKVEVGPAIVQRGDMEIVGWATSPAGIRRVHLRFANGRHVLRADLEPREDVRAQLPWHPVITGFRKTIPAIIEGETDLQIEIIDNAGHKIRMAPFFVEWHRQPISGLEWRTDRLNDLLQRLGEDPAATAPRVISGHAAIHDYALRLLSDPYDETNAAFVERVVHTVIGASSPQLTSPYLRMLTFGITRERVIEAIILSKAFEETYLRSGHMVID